MPVKVMEKPGLGRGTQEEEDETPAIEPSEWKPGESEETPEDHCPHCRHVLDRAACIESDARPEPGDFSVCIYCAGLLRFGPKLGLVAAAQEELSALPAHSRQVIERAQALIRERNLRETGAP